MQNKKLYIIFAVVVILVAAAAFVGGRLLNGGVGPLGLFPMGGGQFAVSVQMTPAPELPTTEPVARGPFVERKDNIIVMQMASLGGDGPGLVVSNGPSAGNQLVGGPDSDAPTVEVVITNETVIYRDTTEFPPPSSNNEEVIIQQKVEEGSLEDLNSNSMIMVWGHKNGDRIIADVILYSQPVIFKREAP